MILSPLRCLICGVTWLGWTHPEEWRCPTAEQCPKCKGWAGVVDSGYYTKAVVDSGSVVETPQTKETP